MGNGASSETVARQPAPRNTGESKTSSSALHGCRGHVDPFLDG